ncbi:MFS transporter [Patescibacteria group bacterium]|jgi:EmrB/QacA subfamily drug resistance transporter|nr:MFS transporter [Patescibacteria group bacterium]
MLAWLTKRVASHSLAVLSVILFLTFLDNTIVAVVLANVQSTLAAGVQALQWVVDGYMLAFAVFMLSGGTLGDLLGRKKVMLSGVSLFVIGSLIAVLAHSVDMLIAGRVVMGLGAAGSEPGTLSMIRQLYPESRARAKALGVWAAVSGIALAFGPIIGGIIIGFSDWRGVFVFNIIFGLIALIAGWRFLPESSDPGSRHLDVYGLISGGIAICAAATAVILGENSGYGSHLIVALFVLSGVSALVFALIERQQKDPVLPLRLFKKLRFSIANTVAFTANFGIFAVFFFVALYLQFIVGFSGYQIAEAFISMTVAIVIAALITGRIYSFTRTLPLVVLGGILSGAGIIVLNQIIKPDVTAAELSWVLALTGLGFGILLVTMTSSVLNIVSAKRSGMASSTVNTFRELGGVFGVAVLGSIVNAQLTSGLVGKLKALNLPTNFQAFVIYAITHGGHVPTNARISISELASHASLVQSVTLVAYAAFGHGLTIALNIAGFLLLIVALVSGALYLLRRGYELEAGEAA